MEYVCALKNPKIPFGVHIDSLEIQNKSNVSSYPQGKSFEKIYEKCWYFSDAGF